MNRSTSRKMSQSQRLPSRSSSGQFPPNSQSPNLNLNLLSRILLVTTSSILAIAGAAPAAQQQQSGSLNSVLRGPAPDQYLQTLVLPNHLHNQKQQHQQYSTLNGGWVAAAQPTARCSPGAPLQWRPYLDAASKAHLAPAVAIGSLQQLSLNPVQVGGATSSLAPGATLQQQLASYHPQNVNSAGLTIEATFLISSVLKRSGHLTQLHSNQTIKLYYKVSASLSLTTSLQLMQLVKIQQSQVGNNQSSISSSSAADTYTYHPNHNQFYKLQKQSQLQQQQQTPICSLELSEHELTQKASKIFKLKENYILFLDQAQITTNQQQIINPKFELLHPFASHEPLNNQTSRSIRKILCKDCAQVPQIQLLNATFVSIVSQGQQQQQKLAVTGAAHKIKLDCKVTGYPAPWVQWFKNGKLLRNRLPNGRLQVRTSKWKRRHNVRLSRLELELRAGRNETGIYECRAMNVVAREPVVGTYTLLVLPAHYALIPMQQPQQPQQPAGGRQASGQPTAAPSSRSTPVATSQVPPTQLPAASAGAIPTLSPNQQPASKAADAGNGKWNQTSGANQSTTATIATTTTTTFNTTTTTTGGLQEVASNSIQLAGTATGSQQQQPPEEQPVVGQPCPKEAHDNFCLNKGTCVLIGHIEEYFCNCAEGYHGHRCEYKSLGHQQATH